MLIRQSILAAICFAFANLTGNAAYAAPAYRGMNVLSDATKADIEDLEALLHPNVIRYTLDWGRPAASADKEQYMSWLSERLNFFDENLLPVLAANGTKVILCLGSPPGGFASEEGPYPQARIFTEAWAQEAVKEVWQYIANRYKDNQTIAAYQLMSEAAPGKMVPPGLLNWYKLQIVLADLVRAIDRTHPLALTADYASPIRLDKIKAPSRIAPVWYSIHVYTPVAFLRQGVDRGIYRTNYPTKQIGKESLRKYLQKPLAFARKNKAKIYVGEFSTSRFGLRGSSTRYLRDLVGLFNQYRWHWTFHAWRNAPIWSVEEPALEDSPGALTGRAKLLKTYFSKR